MNERDEPGAGGVGPLAGFRVIDFTAFVAGPYAGQQLADLGADVIKVEAPSGDGARHLGTSPNGGMGPSFVQLNRNKRSVALDVKHAEGLAALRSLVRDADVFVHNIRPAAAARLGIGYDDLRAERPDLVYCQIVGYGSDGPSAGRPAYDDVIQAASGYADAQGRVSGEPSYAPFALMDNVAGMFASQSILAALLHRERSGEGQLIEVPMLEAGVAYAMFIHLDGRTFDPDAGVGNRRFLSPERRPFATRDGHFSIVMATDAQFDRFFRAVGRPELADDPRFDNGPGRLVHTEDLHRAMGEIFTTRTNAEWAALMDDADLPGVPLTTIEGLFDDPHVRAVELVQRIEHPTEGEQLMIRPPVTFSRTPTSLRLPAPTIGQHNAELLDDATDPGISSG